MALRKGESTMPISSCSLGDFVPMKFEECAKQIHRIIRSSLRNYAQAIEVFREIEDKELEEATHAKAQSYRSLIPLITRIGSAALGAVNLGIGIFPHAVKHSYDWLSSKCSWFPDKLFDSFLKDSKFDYVGFANYLTKRVSSLDKMLEAGREIHGNYENATRADLEGQVQKSQALEDRWKREAQERQSKSDELLNLLQQMNREIADAIRAIARA